MTALGEQVGLDLYLLRLQRLAEQQRVFDRHRRIILGMDQEDWVSRQRYNERDPHELAEQFATMRGFNLHIWRNLTDADKQRGGLHNERGRETLGVMVRMEAGHDLSHIDQLTRYIAAVKALG